MAKEAFSQAVYSVVLFALLAVPGFIFQKKKVIGPKQADGITSLLVNFIWPVMVIDAMIQADLNASTGTQALFAGATTLIGIVFITVLGLGILRISHLPVLRNGIYVFALMFANTGLIGMPLIRTMLGEEALFIASIVELVNDILIFSIGIVLMQSASGKKEKTSIKALLSPGFLGMLLGLLLYLCQIPVPSLIAEMLHMVAQATTPLTMFLVGYQLAEASFKKVFCSFKAYLFAAGKLLLIPALIYLPLKILQPTFTILETSLVLLFAMPSGACCAMFARQYGGDDALATQCVTVTTVLSVFSLPLWMILCVI